MSSGVGYEGTAMLAPGSLAAMPDAEFVDRFAVHTQHRTLEQIAADAGCAVGDLPVFARETALHLLEGGAFEAPFRADVKNLYELYHALHNEDVSEGSDLSVLRENLATYDAFVAAYASGPRKYNLSNLTGRIRRFMDNEVDEMRTRRWSSERHLDRIDYMPQGVWRRLWSAGSMRRFTTQGVVDEILSLDEVVLDTKTRLFHATGSAALAGIAQHQALLSAEESYRRGGDIKSGEYIVSRHFEDRSGLSDVYANKGPVGTAYSTVRWFDEYPVIFGINIERLRRYAEKTGLHLDFDNDGDGITLGPEVPRTLVDTIYVPQLRMKEFEAWRDAHCAWAYIVSIEAGEEAQRIRAAHSEGTLGEPVLVA